VLRLCEVYPGMYLTTEEKARENVGQGSHRMPVGIEDKGKKITFKNISLGNGKVAKCTG